MPENPYEILGVARTATPEEIKKAYRTLSKQWHPDKHAAGGGAKKDAEEKYKKINQAYELLSDEKKRQMYDQYGTDEPFGAGRGAPYGQGFSGFGGGENPFGAARFGDLGDLFETFFSGGASRRRAGGDVQGRDAEAQIRIPLAEAFHGAKKTIRLRTLILCHTCHGTGSREGTKKINCNVCSGTGQVTRTAQSFFGTIRQSVMCDACKGSGKIPESPCGACKGEGRMQGTEEMIVDIPRGIDDGQTLRIHGKGEAGRQGTVAGDLYVHIAVDPDARFAREGDHLRMEMTIPVTDAVLGTEVSIETFAGPVTLRIPEGTQPGQILRIKGKGMPVLSSSRCGDLYVRVQVEVPRKVSRKEMEMWEGLRG